VTYSGGATATAQVRFTVNKADLDGTVTIDVTDSHNPPRFGDELTANAGSLTSTPSIGGLGTLTYEWKRDGSTPVGTNSANYAKDAIEAFFKAGVINGRGNGLFDPTGTATRAELAAMLRRFIKETK
jgi:hypothetical protein